jgi:hypothetical protein
MKEKTVQEVVESLNDRLWGIDGDQNTDHHFSYTEAGYIKGISLNLNFDDYSLGISLWNNENDDRFFIEEKNEYENLEKHLIQKYKNILKDMSKITKYLIK